MSRLEDHDRASIANLLKSFREARKMSVQKFARESGLSRSMVAKLEQKSTTPTITTLRKIAKAFGLTLHELVQSLDVNLAFYKTNVSEVERRVSVDGSFESFPVSSRSFDRSSEVFEFRFLKVGEHTAVRSAGTIVSIFVRQGEMEVEANGQTLRLGPGDFLQFKPAKTYIYRQTKKRGMAAGSVFIRYVG